jgi:hypothetical protein
MAVPNTFSNGTVADADEVNENFAYCTDLIDPLELVATKDVSTVSDGSITTSGTASGTKSDIYDKNLTTYYQVAHSGTTALTAELKIDYGAIMFCGNAFFQIGFIDTTGGGGTTGGYTISSSLDNSTWVTLVTASVGANSTVNLSGTYTCSARYLKIVFSKGSNISGASVTIRAYEVRFCGND